MPGHRRLLLIAVCAIHVMAALPVRAATPVFESDAAPPPSVETLYFENGQYLSGKSLGVEKGEILWELAPEEILRVPLNRVDRLEMGPPPLPEVPPPPPPAEVNAPTPDQPLEEEPPWIEQIPLISSIPDYANQASTKVVEWTKRVQFGGNFNEGNSQTANFTLNADFENSTPRVMRQIETGGLLNRSDGQITANRWWANLNIDWSKTPDTKWIMFVTSKNEYNDLTNLDYRGTVSSGVGYRWINTSDKRLITRLGPGFTTEVFNTPHDVRTSADLYAELELKWPLYERTTFEHKVRVQPNVGDWEIVRVSSTSNLFIPLDEKDRWKLSFGLKYDYLSVPSPGRVPSDVTTSFSIVYLRK